MLGSNHVSFPPAKSQGSCITSAEMAGSHTAAASMPMKSARNKPHPFYPNLELGYMPSIPPVK